MLAMRAVGATNFDCCRVQEEKIRFRFNKTESVIRKMDRQGHCLRRVGDVDVLGIDGVKIAYWHSKRSTRYIVFLHGNSSCKEVFFRQFEMFHDSEYSLLAIDLPGHGASCNAANPEVQYTIPGYALIVKKLLGALGVEAPVVVGWSLGGNIAIEMAGRGFPLRGLFLMGTPPVGPGTENFALAFTPKAIESTAMSEDASDEDLNDFVGDAFGSLNPIPKYFYDAALRTHGRARGVMGEHWASGDEGCDQLTVIAGWNNPIGFVLGTDDALASAEYIKTVTWRRLWRNEIIDMPGCGHAPFIEDPPRFNTYLREFLKELF